MFKKCAAHLPRQLRLCNFSSEARKARAEKKLTKLGVLGVPFYKGQMKVGVEEAPDMLRRAGLVDILRNISNGTLDIVDYGNLRYTPELSRPVYYKSMKNYEDFMGCNKALINTVQKILKDNDQFLILGGDHAIGFGSIAGHLQHTPNLSVVWIDAHADINLHSTSMSGNIHGMPVSFLLEELRVYWKHAGLEKFAKNCLSASQLVYIGLRDIDPFEALILKRLGIRAYAMDDIDKYGIAKILEMTLDGLDANNKIHVSFDIDALDSTVAPSTGTAVHGGLTLREGIYVVESLRKTNRVQGIDLVEVNPLVGSTSDVQTTISAAMEILKSICGYKRGGNLYNVDLDILNVENYK